MAQNITWLGNSYTDVPALTLPKTGGGTARFTDATPTTAVEADVASGKIFVKADGSLGTGTASGGGTSVKTKTGTFTGNNSTTAQISCDFAPDLIYVYGDLSGSNNLRGVISIVIIKDTFLLQTSDTSTSSTNENMTAVYHSVTDYSGSSSHTHATYSNGTLTLDTVSNTSSNRFASGISYAYKLIKWTT